MEKHNAGFTLLELIVVMLLTAILLTAVVGVLRSVIRDSQARVSEALVSEQFIALLQRDLANARFYRSGENRIELLGPLALELATNESTLTEAAVAYSVQPTVHGGLLVRTQSLPGRDPSPGRMPTREPVWLGVTVIDFRTSYLDPAAELSTTGQAIRDGWIPLPPAYRLQIFGRARELLLSESFVGAG